MQADKKNRPEGYLYKILLDGAKPFLYRSRIHSLLGTLNSEENRVPHSTTLLPVGFRYLNHLSATMEAPFSTIQPPFIGTSSTTKSPLFESTHTDTALEKRDQVGIESSGESTQANLPVDLPYIMSGEIPEGNKDDIEGKKESKNDIREFLEERFDKEQPGKKLMISEDTKQASIEIPGKSESYPSFQEISLGRRQRIAPSYTISSSKSRETNLKKQENQAIQDDESMGQDGYSSTDQKKDAFQQHDDRAEIRNEGINKEPPGKMRYLFEDTNLKSRETNLKKQENQAIQDESMGQDGYSSTDQKKDAFQQHNDRSEIRNEGINKEPPGKMRDIIEETNLKSRETNLKKQENQAIQNDESKGQDGYSSTDQKKDAFQQHDDRAEIRNEGINQEPPGKMRDIIEETNLKSRETNLKKQENQAIQDESMGQDGHSSTDQKKDAFQQYDDEVKLYKEGFLKKSKDPAEGIAHLNIKIPGISENNPSYTAISLKKKYYTASSQNIPPVEKQVAPQSQVTSFAEMHYIPVKKNKAHAQQAPPPEVFRGNKGESTVKNMSKIEREAIPFETYGSSPKMAYLHTDIKKDKKSQSKRIPANSAYLYERGDASKLSNREAAERIEQLRQYGQDMVARFSSQQMMNQKEAKKQQPEQTQPLPSQPVVIIRRYPSLTRKPCAFWERSYLSHFYLRLLR